jgi:hypothetical protein
MSAVLWYVVVALVAFNLGMFVANQIWRRP